MKKAKGFTLIELLLTLSIVILVISGIYTFLISSTNANNSVSNEIEIQTQGEKAINFMVDNLIDSYGIAMVNDKLDEAGLKSINGIQVLDKFAVSRKENVDTDTPYFSIFQLKDGQLYYLKNNLLVNDIQSSGTVISNSINSITLNPLPLGSYADAKGVKIVIELKYKDKTKTFSNTVYFRNK